MFPPAIPQHLMLACVLLRAGHMRVSCLVFGHLPVQPFPSRSASRVCYCGKRFFTGAITRIRHVVGCFLSGHDYVFVCAREGHQEYRCVVCGHPLLFREGDNRYAATHRFKKKVRYWCNLLGHDVHHVTERDSVHEYACFCGHTFLKPTANVKKITHPLICLFAGHFVKTIAYRDQLTELLCLHCGHTFLLECADGN